MALAITLRFNFRDEKNSTSFTKIRVPTGFSISDYVEFGQAMGQLLSALSGASVTSASFAVGVDLSGLAIKSAASSLADIAEKGLFIFRTAVTGFVKKLRLPTFREALVPAGSDAIDQVDVDVAAFISAMENGIAVSGPATISPCNDREFDLTTIQEARETKRRTLK